MSHYMIMVVGGDIESLLEPYDENLEVEAYVDKTKEEIHKEFIEFRERVANKPVSERNDFEKSTVDLKKETRRWVKDYYGGEVDAHGNLISTYNPDSKWDWYQVGGRWSGELVLKPGEVGEVGERSWANKDDTIPDNHVDIACKYQIDFDEMNRVARERSCDDWDKLMSDEETCMWKPEYRDEQRKLHIDMYGTKENYMNKRGFWTPYAFVDSEGWHAKGEMGWWGISSDDTGDRDKFTEDFVKYINNLPDDAIITIVDCHI